MLYTDEQYRASLQSYAAQLQQAANDLAAMTAARDGLAGIIATAKALHVSGDHAALEALFTEAEKTDAQRAVEAAESEFAAAQKKLADARAAVPQ